MSHWDSKNTVVVRYPPEPYEGKPGWFLVDCGCCAGIEWGGEYPDECRRCGGDGTIALHLASQRLALYPGGPFCGRPTDGEVASVENLRRDT